MVISDGMDTMNKTKQAATLTADEAHALIGTENISRASFYAALKRREIPHVRLGKRYLIPRQAFSRWLEAAGQPEAGS